MIHLSKISSIIHHLHAAALSGRMKVFKYFTEKQKIDVNLTAGRYKRTALHCAAEKGHLVTVKYLIDTHHCDPLVKNQFNNTYSSIRLSTGGLEVVKYFTEDIKIDVNLTGLHKRTALHHASEKSHLDTVKYLIEVTTVIH